MKHSNIIFMAMFMVIGMSNYRIYSNVFSDSDIINFFNQIKDAKTKGDQKTTNELTDKLINSLNSNNTQELDNAKRYVGNDFTDIVHKVVDSMPNNQNAQTIRKIINQYRQGSNKNK